MSESGLKSILTEAIEGARVLFSCHRGSLAHGMYVPSENPDSVDDTDYFACTVAPIEHYFGITPWGSSDTKEIFIGDDDLLCYDLRKLTKLMLVCNPNVLSFLWMPSYLFVDPIVKPLFEVRDSFISKEAVYKSFCGYARAQLTKIEHTPGRGFRGQKRIELKEKYGYDTKHAAHCVRLLRMGEEFLRTGYLRVDRTDYDAKQLIEIKGGAWSKFDLVKEAEGLFVKIKESFQSSPLPSEPDRKLVEEITVDIFRKTVL